MATPDDAIAPPHLTLDGVITYWAERIPDAPAIEYDTATGPDHITWSTFDRCVNGAVGSLEGMLSRGDIAAVVCDDSVDFHILVNALWRCGVAVLLIDRFWGAAIVEDLLRLTNCSLLFLHNWPVQLSTANVRRADYPIRCETTTRPHRQQENPDDVAILATTSGTTDNPKCVAISHRRVRTAYRTCLAIHDFTSVRRAGALFHINSLGVLGVCFLLPREVGAATRAFPAFTIANIRSTWEALLRSEVDFVYLVPPLVRLLNALPSHSEPRRPLHAFCAAAPVRRDELRRLETKFPVTVFNAYGLTELTFAVFHGCRDDDGLASESIGYPIGIEARIVDEHGTTLPGAARGELYLKGPMLTDGYLHNPAATSETWDDGWLRTGDIAERDHHGRYYICGRMKDTVLRGGVTYYLHELEHYLRRAPNVIDACAFKGRDLPSGDELCVVVQVARPTEQKDLLAWVYDQMGEGKVPNILIVSDQALPRNSNGKVLRQVVARRYLDGELR